MQLGGRRQQCVETSEEAPVPTFVLAGLVTVDLVRGSYITQFISRRGSEEGLLKVSGSLLSESQ